MRTYFSQPKSYILYDLLGIPALILVLSVFPFSSFLSGKNADPVFYITQYSSFLFSIYIAMVINLFLGIESYNRRSTLCALIASRKQAYRTMLHSCLIRLLYLALLLPLPALLFHLTGILPVKLTTLFFHPATDGTVVFYQWIILLCLVFFTNAFLIYNSCRPKPWRFDGGIFPSETEIENAPKMSVSSFVIYILFMIVTPPLNLIIVSLPLPFLFLCCAVILILSVVLLGRAAILIQKQEYVR